MKTLKHAAMMYAFTLYIILGKFAIFPIRWAIDFYKAIGNEFITKWNFGWSIAFAITATPFYFVFGLAGAAIALASAFIVLPTTAIVDIIKKIKEINSNHHTNTITDTPLSERAIHQRSSSSNITSSLRNNNQASSASSVKKLIERLASYSESTKDYVEKFADKKTFSEIISNLDLSDKDKKRLHKFCCKYSKNLADIPVYLNENLFNLTSLIDALEKDRRDPLRGLEFDAIQIQPARDIKMKIEEFIKQHNINPDQPNKPVANRVTSKRYPKYTFSDIEPETLRKKLTSYSDYTNSYIAKFQNQKNYLDTICDMKLTDEEKKLFKEINCPISQDVPNIPVKLNGNIYDLDWLLQAYECDGLDPINKYKFDLIEIQPANDVKERIEAALCTIEIQRMHEEKFTSENFPGYVFSK